MRDEKGADPRGRPKTPVAPPAGSPRDYALITAGRGEPPLGKPPLGADVCWRVEETILKHFVTGAKGPWRVPISEGNLLGFDWIAVRYGESVDAIAKAYEAGPEAVAFVARLIVAPPPA